MSYNYIQDETRNFKTVEYSLVPIGKPFFKRRPFPGSDEGKMVKIQTERKGNSWVNAKTATGLLGTMFVPYDSKVLIEVDA